MDLDRFSLSVLFALARERDVFLFRGLLEEKTRIEINGEFVERLPLSNLKTFLLSNSTWKEKVLKNRELIEMSNTKILTPMCETYPQNLLALENPPIFLNYEGESLTTTRLKLAVVGSRDFHSDSMIWMENELTSIVKSGVVTISGAARGIDQRAHRVSIINGAPTIAFLPSGLSKMYPRGFLSWKAKLFDTGGSIVSEYLPEVEMRKHHFFERNRMIAALGNALLVVEARLRSGTIMTANLASEISKTVLVLPASPHSTHHQGNLKLIFEGAHMVRSSEDVMSSLALERERVL